MQNCPPDEFLKRFPGSLHSVIFAEPSPVLPDDCKRFLADFGLPRKLTIYCYNDMTLTFTGKAAPLSEIWERDLKRGFYMGEMPPDWTRFFHLADQKYTQGGGWICIEEGSGKLFVIDSDQTDPVYLLNSSVHNFYTTLAYFLDWTEKSGGSLKEIEKLNEDIRNQDCISVEELEPFWINFIEATLDCSELLRIKLE